MAPKDQNKYTKLKELEKGVWFLRVPHFLRATLTFKQAYVYALLRERRNNMLQKNRIKESNSAFHFSMPDLAACSFISKTNLRLVIEVLEEKKLISTYTSRADNKKMYIMYDREFFDLAEKWQAQILDERKNTDRNIESDIISAEDINNYNKQKKTQVSEQHSDMETFKDPLTETGKDLNSSLSPASEVFDLKAEIDKLSKDEILGLLIKEDGTLISKKDFPLGYLRSKLYILYANQPEVEPIVVSKINNISKRDSNFAIKEAVITSNKIFRQKSDDDYDIEDPYYNLNYEPDEYAGMKRIELIEYIKESELGFIALPSMSNEDIRIKIRDIQMASKSDEAESEFCEPLGVYQQMSRF